MASEGEAVHRKAKQRGVKSTAKQWKRRKVRKRYATRSKATKGDPEEGTLRKVRTTVDVSACAVLLGSSQAKRSEAKIAKQSIAKQSEANGALLRSPALSGALRRSLALSGGLWRSLALSGALWLSWLSWAG